MDFAFAIYNAACTIATAASDEDSEERGVLREIAEFLSETFGIGTATLSAWNTGPDGRVYLNDRDFTRWPYPGDMMTLLQGGTYRKQVNEGSRVSGDDLTYTAPAFIALGSWLGIPEWFRAYNEIRRGFSDVLMRPEGRLYLTFFGPYVLCGRAGSPLSGHYVVGLCAPTGAVHLFSYGTAQKLSWGHVATSAETTEAREQWRRYALGRDDAPEWLVRQLSAAGLPEALPERETVGETSLGDERANGEGVEETKISGKLIAAGVAAGVGIAGAITAAVMLSS